MKTLCIIPTYNEIENIAKILNEIRALPVNVDVLIVDDNSPDGTATIVKNEMQSDNHLFLLERPGKLGLGTAYVAGFKWALINGYKIIIQMDSDFSHDPKEIPNFLEAITDADLVIGSRYLKGFNVVNWPLRRKILSYGANFYSRLITRIPLKDATGGFKCFRQEVLEVIDLTQIKSSGYSFQIEINFKAWKKGFKLKEIPIIFVDRSAGNSKMNLLIIFEAIFVVWKLKLQSIFSK